MSIPQSELIIFDCDGVLVDSEPIVNRILAEVLSEAGFSITYEEIARQFTGKSFQTFVEVIEASYGKPIPPASLKLRKEREIAALRQEIQATPGILSVLEQIALPKCVASNSSHQHLQLVLQLTDLLPHFEGRIYSCHDVDRPKPFPDVYLHAARQMGKAPQNCIVIEDSVTGVQAAIAAGMTVLGYAPQGNGNEDGLVAAGAELVFADMRQLPSILGIGVL